MKRYLLLVLTLLIGYACGSLPSAPSMTALASGPSVFHFPVIWTHPDPYECESVEDAGKAFFDADDATLWVCDGFRQSGWRAIDATRTYHVVKP